MLENVDRETETELLSALDLDRVEADVEKMSGLHRYPGTDDQWEAAEYVVERLSVDGVNVEMKTFDAYVSVPEDATVSVTSPIRRTFEDAITIAFSANTPHHGISGEVVHVKSFDPDSATLARIEGKIVFSQGLLTPANAKILDENGAAAAVFQSPTKGQLHEMTMSPIWGTPSIDNRDDLPNLPVAEIAYADGEWLAEQIAGDTVEATVTTKLRSGPKELPCPIAKVDGTMSDRYFVVGNHIDSWHEGVTDNGTAVAASMELARVFSQHPPKRGILFGFWPGHSMGRYAGSARYADKNWMDLRENGVCYYHLDLNGLKGADHLWYQHMSEVEDEHLDVLEGELSTLAVGGRGGDQDDLLGHTDRPGRSSDQSFWGAGLSSLSSGARFSGDNEDGGPIGGGWWWHTPEDTIDKVDFEVLGEELQLFTAVISRFCNSPVLPHDFRKTAAEIRSTVEDIEQAADRRVEFSSIYERLNALEENLAEMTRTIEDVDEQRVDPDIEDVQVRLGNLLIPALYMEFPEYEHDPAMPHELLPYLRAAEELPTSHGTRGLFTEVKIDRGIAKLSHRIDEAVRTTDLFLRAR